MTEIKTPFSIKLIYWLTNFMMGLLGIVFLLALAFNIAVFTGHELDDTDMRVQLPAKVDIAQQGTLQVMGEEITVQLVDAESQLRLVNPPSKLIKYIMVSILLLILGVAYLVCQFRTIVKNVRNGLVFEIENIRLLKKIAYILAGFWLVMLIYIQVGTHIVQEHMHVEGVSFSGDPVSTSNVLVMSLCLWVLAHIFSTGLKMKEEQALTI